MVTPVSVPGSRLVRRTKTRSVTRDPDELKYRPMGLPPFTGVGKSKDKSLHVRSGSRKDGKEEWVTGS